MTDNRPEGVLFSNEAGVFFVPKARLHEFQVAGDEAERLKEEFDGDVSGFASRDMFGGVKPVTWGFSGPVGLGNTGTSEENYLVWSPPPKR